MNSEEMHSSKAVAAQTAIPITMPFLDEEEIQAVAEPLRTGWVAQGAKVAEFEKAVAAFTGARHAVATSSCTTALHLSLLAAGVGPGDEVIVPAFTWISSANAVEHAGAQPVFCDIDLETFNIDVAATEKLITPRTRAVMPVHLFGLCADMAPLVALANAHNLEIIEDAACALDSWYQGDHAGRFGSAGCFSFHPRKLITTGEGGMVITDDEDMAATCRSRRDHGASRSDRDRHKHPGSYILPDFAHLGYNYRMTDLQGAVGVAQMGKLEAISRRRRELAARYDEGLRDLAWVDPPVSPAGSVHSYQSYVCLFFGDQLKNGAEDLEHLNERRVRIMEALEAGGVATRPGTHAVHLQEYYANKYGLEAEDFPQTLAADRLSVALPLFTQMRDEDVDRVLELIGSQK